MSKKKTKKTNKLGYLVAGALLLVALILWFVLPAVKWVVGDNVTNYTFLQSTFGFKEDVIILGEVTVLNFSVAGLIGLVVLVLALGVSVYHFLAKKSALGDYAHFIVLALGLIAGVLVLLSKTTLQIESVLIDPEKVHLATGSYAVGIMAIVAGVVPFGFKLIK